MRSCETRRFERSQQLVDIRHRFDFFTLTVAGWSISSDLGEKIIRMNASHSPSVMTTVTKLRFSYAATLRLEAGAPEQGPIPFELSSDLYHEG